MTIICYRDGVMAADSATISGVVTVGHRNKVVRGGIDGIPGIAGASGLTSCCEHFREWFAGGCQDPFEPKGLGDEGFGALMALVDGSVWYLDAGFRKFKWTADFYADGSGRDLALGAMAAGVSASEAVRIAIEYDAYCGGVVTSLQLRED